MSDGMRITVEIDGRKLVAKQPFAKSDHVIVKGCTQCPACKQKFPDGLPVMGRGNHIENHDTYKATAHGKCCEKVIGVIRVKVSTIFGLEEDEAVLIHGRCRVY